MTHGLGLNESVSWFIAWRRQVYSCYRLEYNQER